ATSHILPEAHARHSSRWTLVATIAGVLVMWGLVSQLHSVHIHSHDETGHSVESDHKDGHESEEDHEEEHDHRDGK
ncbi:MAG: hypothetical protein RLZZ527_220, partial [Actinomycetota bacterium]